ncbi:hypothetical protein ERO13_A11G277000v2 [Gossypium hirsutum]|nr:hypothetical protein ERO13_A11G277000v2 [Gossypium hirsutum]
MNSAASFDFLLKPIFLHGFSASLHLVLLLLLLILWVVSRVKKVSREGSKERQVLWYKQTLACCFVVSVSNVVLCLLSYFYWYTNSWSEDKLMSLIDYALKTLAWGACATCVYMHCQFSNEQKRFPVVLRIWWAFYFSISCYCLVIGIVLFKKHVSFPSQYLVSDVLSVVTGLFLCIVGFFLRNEGEDTLLEEPLLNGDSSVTNGVVLSKEKGRDTVTPYSNAGIFSILTFSWMGPLIAVGNKKPLDLEDVPQLDGHDSVIEAFPKFKNRLESADSEGNGVTSLKLVKALFFSNWKDILWTALFAFMYTVASYVGPYLIDTFVQYLNGQKEFKAEGYLLVAAFFVAKLVECLSERRWFFKLQQVGLRQRAVLVAMIYNKGLTLSCQSKQSHTSGEIINFMTVDAERVGGFSWYMHDPWMIVLQVALALLILYKTLGLASIVTFIATVLVMLANIPLGKMQQKFQDKLMESKDTRMKATSEILRNMRILKLQGWEMKFLGVPLESGKILSALATFRILQEPIYNLPDTISMIAQTKVSLDRIAAFLRLDDLQPGAIEKLPSGSSDTAIEIADGNFFWDMSSPTATLKDINLKVSHGMSVAVSGTVGSGKSSLLSCVLGEFSKTSGTLKLCGTTAYVAQSPWIQSGKIVDNILFGKEMDRDKYDEVLEACILKKDLEILPFGDQTVIGERGINLSGGQKQRIQIARALYQDADIYLFDDPFSALDAHTGSHLFKKVLLKNLRSKTVIYVTHQVEFLPAADLILVMKDGRIVQAGKYNDILNSGTDFMELVGAHKKALSTLVTIEASSVFEQTISEGECDIGTTNGKVQKEENQGDKSGKVDDVGPKGQLVQEEEREKGQVGFLVYWKYITTAYGGALVPLILLAQILFQIFQIGSNYWMAWGSPMSADIKPPVGSFTLIMVYLALAIASAICVFAKSMLLGTAGYKTATLLFKKMHLCIFRAPMSFFDSTPSGRILNRASTDQSAVDMDIAHQVATFAFSVIQLLGIIAVMSQVAWQIFIIFVPVIATCILYQQYYISSARELSRLVGVCKAPVIQNFAETILGATTIKSFDQEKRFQDINMALTDSYSRPKFYVAGAMEWLCFRLDLLSSVTFAFSLFFLISIPEGIIDPAIAGLAVTTIIYTLPTLLEQQYGLNLNILQAWVVWTIILQYCSIPSEPALVVETNHPDHCWPYHGEVHIRDLQVRYAPHMPLVLRGLTCTFPGGLKTGIVGRTGSGKSTLIQTLFRIVEPASGQIIIDGLNISSIGLHDLHSRLSIIPQEPTMFEGTIRSNLDPLEEYTDEQIWEIVQNKADRLDSSVSENGENWSMGQRQLVCLGRVLLKKSKILVLDEATASVDTATDNLIQTTLREHFSGCTVITIAHRITSVLDSDMVLLLRHGVIEEYDSPSSLLENKSSSFAQLVAEYSMRSNSGF